MLTAHVEDMDRIIGLDLAAQAEQLQAILQFSHPISIRSAQSYAMLEAEEALP